jgi:hypothetical protein
MENFSCELRNDTELAMECIKFVFGLFDYECLRDDIANLYHTISVEI